MKYTNLITRLEDQGTASLRDDHDFDGPFVGGLLLAAGMAIRDLSDVRAVVPLPAAPKAPKPAKARAPRGARPCTLPPTEPGKKPRHRFDDVTGYCPCGVNKDGSVQGTLPGSA